jgi:hypothetical protein
MRVVISQDWKQKVTLNRDESPSVPAELLSVNNWGCLGFSGGRNGGFPGSFRRQFMSLVSVACWDARRWLVVDSLTSPTHRRSLSGL